VNERERERERAREIEIKGESTLGEIKPERSGDRLGEDLTV
jgi:hypothetical protein